jgi:ribulose-phosphate 3-epimerase
VHLHRTLQQIKALGKRAGVSLNPHTPIGVLDVILPDLDSVLIMTVNPGFGGQAFIPAMADKIVALRAMIGDRPIHLEVDGGITVETAATVAKAGADVLVAGSAVFKGKHADYGGNIAEIRASAAAAI